MISTRDRAKEAAAANAIRGLLPIRGSSPEAEGRAEEVRSDKMHAVERLIAVTRQSAHDHETDGLFDAAANLRAAARELEERAKKLRLETRAHFWTTRRQLSAAALLARFSGV